jgi:hypothetical protein
MSGGAAFGVAAIGGMIAGIIAYVAPDLINLAENDEFVLNWGRLLSRKFPIVLLLTLVAGVFSVFALNPQTASHAFYAGLGVQAAMKGVSATFRDIVPAGSG